MAFFFFFPFLFCFFFLACFKCVDGFGSLEASGGLGFSCCLTLVYIGGTWEVEGDM